MRYSGCNTKIFLIEILYYKGIRNFMLIPKDQHITGSWIRGKTHQTLLKRLKKHIWAKKLLLDLQLGYYFSFF